MHAFPYVPDDSAVGAHLCRVSLSIGTLDLLRFVGYRHAFPRHAHEEFTVGVFESDNGRIGYRGCQWPAFDGGILAIAPDAVHTAEPLRGRGWTYRAMYPSPQLVATALGVAAETRPGSFREPVLHDPVLAATLARLHARLMERDATLEDETIVLGALRELMLRHGVVPDHVPPCTAMQQAVECAREQLRTRYAEPVRLADLSIACGVSPYHLVRSFTDIVGMPPHAFLLQVRVHRARELLLAGESPSGVAYLSGFCDQAHLTRTFKKVLGVTPGSYLPARCAAAPTASLSPPRRPDPPQGARRTGRR